MPFTIVAFAEDIDEAGIFEKLTGVSDQHVKVSGDKITIGDFNQIIGAYAVLGTTADEARLVSPSLRRVNPFYISPIEALLVPESMPALMFQQHSPIALDFNEALEAEAKANPAAAEQHAVIVFLSKGAITPVSGEMFTVNCEVTLAQLAGAWAFSEITFPDSLPVADYDIVGARLLVAAGVAFRFVLVGEAHRPGGITAVAVNNHDPVGQRFGGLGVWGSFNTVQPPGIEVLSSAAVGSATYQVYIDVIKK